MTQDMTSNASVPPNAASPENPGDAHGAPAGDHGRDSYDDLPSPQTRRWDTKRKAQVVEAVRRGRITLEKACQIYAMSVDEFLAWQSLFDRYGAKGLMATRVKEFRDRRFAG